MKRRGLFALVLSLSLGGCARPAVGPPPPSPGLSAPGDALPADLDVVIRLDLKRMQSALGPELVAGLRQAADLAGDRAKGEIDVTSLLEHTDVVLLGVRPRLSSSLDHVLILEGSYAGFDPGKLEGWEPAVDLGGDVRRWDRRVQPERGLPARIYVWSDRLIVLVTPAEIDSTELAIERAEREGALSPPSKGVFSFAARVLPLAQALSGRSPEIARVLTAADRLEGSAELGADGVHIDLGLSTDSPETAQQLRELLAALTELFALKGRAAVVARAARFDVAGSYVTCRIDLPREAIAALLRCADGERPCAW